MCQSEVYVAADLYLGYNNIIRRNNRPFMNVEEMNKLLLRNWNDTVCSDDIVYFLGDISYGESAKNIDYWLKRLSGNIVFIKGDYDFSDEMYTVIMHAYFEVVELEKFYVVDTKDKYVLNKLKYNEFENILS